MAIRLPHEPLLRGEAVTKFRDRLAQDRRGYLFDCYRAAEPPPDPPRFRPAPFSSKYERDRYVTRHDAIFHDQELARVLGIDDEIPSLGAIVVTFFRRREKAASHDPARQ